MEKTLAQLRVTEEKQSVRSKRNKLRGGFGLLFFMPGVGGGEIRCHFVKMTIAIEATSSGLSHLSNKGVFIMSKTVTIPNCMSPFIVMVNGMRYVYPAGETMEVPDEVALVIEKHYAYHEEKEKIERGEGNQGGGSSEYVDYFVMRITNQELSEYRNDTITKLHNYSFAGWYGLRNVNLPELIEIGPSAFYAAGPTKFDFKKVNIIKANAFGWGNVETLIIRTPSVCTLENENALTGCPIAKGTGYIYVPTALVDSYKAATNWSTYANQIRAIEDYPDITGGTDEPISTEGYETNVDGTA